MKYNRLLLFDFRLTLFSDEDTQKANRQSPKSLRFPFSPGGAIMSKINRQTFMKHLLLVAPVGLWGAAALFLVSCDDGQGEHSPIEPDTSFRDLRDPVSDSPMSEVPQRIGAPLPPSVAEADFPRWEYPQPGVDINGAPDYRPYTEVADSSEASSLEKEIVNRLPEALGLLLGDSSESPNASPVLGIVGALLSGEKEAVTDEAIDLLNEHGPGLADEMMTRLEREHPEAFAIGGFILEQILEGGERGEVR